MPALNFMERFAADVESGKKRQTIRKPRKDALAHAMPGDTIKLFTGMRTKNCRLLGSATVTATSSVRIEESRVYLFETPRTTTCDEFARADGFSDFNEMAAWFRDVHGLPFEGVVIHWGEILRPTYP